MEAYVKSFATYRTIKQATAISSPLVLDSMDAENSTVTVNGRPSAGKIPGTRC